MPLALPLINQDLSIFITLYRKLGDFFHAQLQRLCKPNGSSAESLAHMLQSVWGEGREQLSELLMIFLPEIARFFFPVLVMLVQYSCLKPTVCSYQIKVTNRIFSFRLFYKSDSYCVCNYMCICTASALTCQKGYWILLGFSFLHT